MCYPLSYMPSRPGKTVTISISVDEGRLDAARYDSFIRLARERHALEEAQAEKALIDRRRAGRIGSKALRAMQKQRGR